MRVAAYTSLSAARSPYSNVALTAYEARSMSGSCFLTLEEFLASRKRLPEMLRAFTTHANNESRSRGEYYAYYTATCTNIHVLAYTRRLVGFTKFKAFLLA